MREGGSQQNEIPVGSLRSPSSVDKGSKGVPRKVEVDACVDGKEHGRSLFMETSLFLNKKRLVRSYNQRFVTFCEERSRSRSGEKEEVDEGRC